MARGLVNGVVVGADRIAANGDTANKIGTWNLALLARENQIPFYVAAPSTTFDLNIQSGRDIPIEERPISEVTHINQVRITPRDVPVYNFAFDVTPAELITGFFTEKGLLSPPYAQSIAAGLGHG
jgi:methylthioribose-1-phosphate isomerase